MLDIWERINKVIHTTVGIEAETLDHILWSALIILHYFIFRGIARKLIDKYWENPSGRYAATKTSSYLLGFAALIVLVRIWLGGVSGIMTYLGLVSAGIALTLKDPLVNVAGWLFIIVRGPFQVGDRIEISNTAGDVIDIRLFQFSMIEIGNWVHDDQSTGRIIHLPNGIVFQNTLANYTQGFKFIWNELEVVVTFESDWQDAKELLQTIADRNCAYDSKRAEKEVRETSHKYLIHYRYLTPIVWTAVVDHGVKLTIRYPCDPRERRSTAMKIWEDVLREFGKRDDIDFAYPTQRLYFNPTEGKPAAGGTGHRVQVAMDDKPAAEPETS